MKPKLSFSTLGCPVWNLGRIVGAATEYGYDAIDFRGLLECDEIVDSPAFRGSALSGTARRIRDAGLGVSCLSSGAVLCVPDGSARARQLDAIRRYADLCGPLGCRAIRVFCGRTEGIADPVASAAGTLAAAAETARAAGVEILVETHDDWTDTARLRSAFDAAGAPEGAGFVWDVHHPWTQRGEAPETSLANLSPFVRNTHWKDSRPVPGGGRRLCLPGEGDVPLRRIFGVLAAANYDGWFTLEWEKRWHPDIEEPEAALSAFAPFVRGLAGQSVPPDAR